MSNDDELLIMPNQIPPECIKTFEELSGLGATPAEILAGVLNAWPRGRIRTRPRPDPDNGGQWILPEDTLSLPLQEHRT
jgi:hypothetical protein